MTAEEIRDLCLSMPGSYEDYPFGPVPVCFRLQGRVFAQLYPDAERFMITLKCTRGMGEFYRSVYPGVVVRGYHCPAAQQPYWNTVVPNRIPEEELRMMIHHAYQTVLESLPKRVQAEIRKSC